MTASGHHRRRRRADVDVTHVRRLVPNTSRNVFAEFEPDAPEGHPVHELIHRDPKLRRLLRSAATLAKRVEPQVRVRDWIRFMDSRSVLQEAELQATFGVGFQQGMVAGRIDALKRDAPHRKEDRREQVLRRGIQSLLLKVGAPERAVALLLEFAWALVSSARSIAPSRSNTKSRRRPTRR